MGLLQNGQWVGTLHGSEFLHQVNERAAPSYCGCVIVPDPWGKAEVATQQPALTNRPDVQRATEKLSRCLGASGALIQALVHASGHNSLPDFTPRDITGWKREAGDVSALRFAGKT